MCAIFWKSRSQYPCSKQSAPSCSKPSAYFGGSAVPCETFLPTQGRWNARFVDLVSPWRPLSAFSLSYHWYCCCRLFCHWWRVLQHFDVLCLYHCPLRVDRACRPHPERNAVIAVGDFGAGIISSVSSQLSTLIVMSKVRFCSTVVSSESTFLLFVTSNASSKDWASRSCSDFGMEKWWPCCCFGCCGCWGCWCSSVDKVKEDPLGRPPFLIH